MSTPREITDDSGKKTYVDAEGKPMSKKAFNKWKKKQWQLDQKKTVLAEKEKKKAERQKEDDAKRKENLEAAKKIVLEDKSEEKATYIKVQDAGSFVGKRVEVKGWVDTVNSKGKSLMFLRVRDGTGEIQSVLNGLLCQTYDALVLTRESTVMLRGSLAKDDRAPGGVELQCDYWELIGLSPDLPVNQDTKVAQMLDQKHLYARMGKAAKILRLKSIVVQCFREHFFSKRYSEVIPPTIVQTQVEGGSTLFDFNFFGEKAYLTQSSQLYLETMLPVMGDVFCIAQSYRAEKSLTPRHLAEFTHIEAERPFITFENLLETVEDLICDVTKRIFEKAGDLVKDINPDAKIPSKPFKRMDYEDCIKFCNDNNIFQDESKVGGKKNVPFKIGDDITDKPERQMIAMIGEPVSMVKFPTEMKSFYMARVPENKELTESVDVLLPGVGETIGGSMRMWDEEELLAAYKKEGIDPQAYYWYIDQRKYGTCQHGGYGLGLERYLMWLTGSKSVKDVSMYPRFMGRAKP